MNKKSITKDITNASYLFLITTILFIIGVITYTFYITYLNNLKFLENQAFKNYTNVIYKINENVISRYKVEYKLALKRKENQIRNRIFLAYSLIQNLYFNYSGKLSENEIKKRAIYLLSLIRFDNGKSVFNIFSYKNCQIIFAPNFEEVSFSNVFKKIMRNIRYGNLGPFLFYLNDPEKTSMIIYGIYFDKFDWIIINGFTISDFNKNFDKNFLKRIIQMKFPQYTGMMIFDKNYKPLFSWNIMCKDIFKALKKDCKNSSKITFCCKHYHYTLVKNEIFENHWKIYSFFINEKVENTFKNVRKKLFKNFIFQVSLVIIFVLIGFFLFHRFIKKLKQKLSNQFSTLLKFIKKVPHTYEKVDINKLVYREIEEIGKYSNEMVDTIKKLNDEIIKEKDFFYAVLENLPYGVGVLTTDLKISYVNNYVFSYMGYDKSIIGKSFYYLVPSNFDKNRFILPEIIKKVEKSKKSIILEKILLYKKSGDFIYSTLAVSPIINKDKEIVEKVVFVFYDITEEVKLKREILKLKRAVENVPVSIVITDTQCRIEYVNPFFQEITGYSFDEAKGKTPKILATNHNHKYYPELMKTLKEGKTWEGEFLNRKKNGELYWEHALISPIFDEKGKIVNYVAVKEDITERKKFIEELKSAKEKAELASKAKSEFLANMSHEIRTPMNAIIGFIDLVLETKLDETQKKYLELVKESTDNLLRILNDILDISKFESAKIEFENNTINIKKIITNCASIFSKKINEKHLELSINIDEKIPDNLIGDEVRISQVLNNLLNNAIKFTEKGKIKIEAKLVNKNNDNVVLEICVSDTGIGIPKDKINTIFDTFTQADSSITRKYGGTGLGLAIAQRIVNYYNGKIWVESEIGKGSKFCFTLQLKIGEYQQLKKEEINFNDFKKFSHKFKILVAEDNITNQILIEHILKNYGLEVSIAENGLKAIEKLAKENYDLVLMDWHMPEMNGVEALEILRKLEKGEDVVHEKIDKSILEKLKGKKFKIVALTAAALKSEKESLLKKGFNDYISKPIKKKELNKILRKYLNIEENHKSNIIEIDSNYLKSLIGEDEDIIKTIFDTFLQTFNESLEKLEFLIKEKDFENIYKISHNLKGASANIGLKEIENICKEIEIFCKSKNMDKIKEKYNLLKNINFSY